MTFKIKMECEKWPKTKTGTLSLEVITSEERQQNSHVGWSVSAKACPGRLSVGFAFFFFP